MPLEAKACADNSHYVKHLEHVQVVITLTFTRRGDLTIRLISPKGTAVILLPRRKEDYSGSGFTDWEFMSTHTWGEDPKGTWTLELENHGTKSCDSDVFSREKVKYNALSPPNTQFPQ